MTVRLAVVGAGRMGRKHIAAAEAAAGIELVAVVDPQSPDATVGSIAELPAAGVTAAVMAAPTPQHVELVTALLDLGLDVLSEKPVGLDPDALPALAEHATACGRVVAVGFWRRSAWPYLEALRLVRAGAIGRPVLVRGAHWNAVAPPPEFCDVTVSGGIEVDCGVHEFDIARLLLGGEIETVTAFGATPSALDAVGDVETAAGIARLTNGTVTTLDLTRTAGYANDVRTEVIGESGSLQIQADGRGYVKLGDAGGLRETVQPPADDVLSDALVRQLTSFAEAIDGAEPRATLADAEAALRAGLAMRASRLRRPGGTTG